MKDLKSAILLFIVFTVICGGIYPAVVTGLAHAFSRNRPTEALSRTETGG